MFVYWKSADVVRFNEEDMVIIEDNYFFDKDQIQMCSLFKAIV